MKAKAGEFPLHEQLKNYLTRKEVSYEPIKLRITSRSPYRVSQDGRHFFELNILGEQINSDAQHTKLDLAEIALILFLEDWRFVLVKSSPSDRLRVDIEAPKYTLIKKFDFKPQFSPGDACICLFEISPFRELLEEEQKKAALYSEGPQLLLPSDCDAAHPLLEPGRLDTRGDASANRNKNSLRRNNSNSKLQGAKESLEKDAAKKRTDPGDFTGQRNLTGLGVSGPQGKNNMQRLRETRSKYITNSQESFTDHLVNRSHNKAEMPSLRALYSQKDEDADCPPQLGKRENGLQSSPQFKQPSEKGASQIPLQVSNIKEQSFAGSCPEPLPEKRQVLTHKSEVTFREVSEQSAINYDELMECLAFDKSLLKWEDMVFAKEVVQHLKNAFIESDRPNN